MRTETLFLPAVALLSFPLLGKGDAKAAGTTPEAGPPGALMSWADVDGDGLVDVVTRGVGGELILLQNRGAGGFEDATADWGLTHVGPVRTAHWLALESEDRPELVVLDGAGRLRVFRNTGGTLTESVWSASGSGESALGFAARALQWTDVDQDGRLDLVVSGGGQRRLLRNLGDLAFEALMLPPGPASGLASAVRLERALGTERSTLSPIPDEAARTSAFRAWGRKLAGPGSSPNPERESASSRKPVGQPLIAGAPICPSTIEDRATGACLEASSSPTFGRLFPLSTELNVDPTGRVGMGTVAPQGSVHIAADGGSRVQTASLFSEDQIVEAADAVLGVYSWGSGSWGSAIALGELSGSGVLEDKWSIARNTDAAGSSLHFTFGSDPNYSLNAHHLSLASDGGVGIGTTSPSNRKLRVIQGNTSGYAIEGRTTAASNAYAAIYGYHAGNQPGLKAYTTTGDYSIEGNGMRVTQGGDEYALRAENNGGTAAFFDGAVEVGAPDGPFFSDAPRVILDRDPGTGAGRAIFRNGGQFVADMVKIEATKSGGLGSAITMRNGSGVALILDTNHAGSGKSRVTTDVLEITGGADLVEHFDAGEERVEPGTVLVIDPDRPGRLTVAAEPYDRRVAGVVSGAGGIEPGLSMGQEGVASGDTAVALTGRVYVKATCEAGAIRPGDRLTTSSTAGAAMRVADPARADGAVLGKAMSALEEGSGLVLVLVNLQ